MMSGSQFTFLATIGLAPPAALVGGIVVVLLTQNIAVGVIAGIVGLAVGLVVGFVIAVIWLNRWPDETDDVDLERFERALREYEEWDSRPHSRITLMFHAAFFTALPFGGPITALAVTFLVGWLVGG